MLVIAKIGIEFQCGHQAMALVDVTASKKAIAEFEYNPEKLEQLIYKEYDFEDMHCTDKKCRKHNKQFKRMVVSCYEYL